MTELGRFGRYEAFEELGSGAMGKVFLAVDPLIDRMVAVKVIRADLLEPAERVEFLERFRLEVRAAARCAHPNIVAVYDFADHDAMPYIVMEHVPGRTLSAILRGDPQARLVAAPGLTHAMLSVLEGLKAAHALGVIHRDIKPGNIMITPRDQVKITDFGIAKFGGGELTQVGGVVGTPSYMSPEQALGREVDPRTDLFSVAAILYEILFGRAPFAGNNMTDTLMRLTGPAPADLGQLAGTPLGEVLRQGLAKNPEERFADATAFADALREALAVRQDARPGMATPVPEVPAVAPTRASGAAPWAAPPPAAEPRPAPPVIAPPAIAPSGTDPMRRLAALRGQSPPSPSAQAPRPLAPPPLAQSPLAQPPLTQPASVRSPPQSQPERAAPSGNPTTASPVTGSGGLSAKQIEAASAELAFVVGPIARLLVGKAAAQATTTEEFVDLLCAHAAGQEAVALRKKLVALM
ncbi:serine/threonine-protein kinase [Sediminicoccus sp. KRV36]|uniref:serine/threonine-protein kinase n=1 Tax=Sediminicoccus sp. KRV36 TaxID=3133721 RepID=UPI00200C988B|nr:serine/threonine-protein kinase [Sediminicoccus rosea]UPY37356.1 protein kinase [Sediminicoccus rosea]